MQQEGLSSETLPLLYPLLVQVLLTAIIWTRLLYGRISIHFIKHIPPQVVASESEAKKIYQKLENTSDNLENLFEMPVLFYTVVILIFLTKTADLGMTALAWIFVLFRILHSWIHVTSNRIIYRVRFYLISSAALWVMWIRLALSVAVATLGLN